VGLIIADRVRETSTTSGTGALTLAGAVSGYQRFSAVCSVGDEVQYVITEGASWEVGVGIYSGTNTLTRSTVLASSNAGSLVSFTGASKDVVLTFPARAAAGVPNRNLLVNSSFRFWQRGTSLTLADGAMGPDGWFVLSESGSVTCTPGSNFYGVGVGKYAVAEVSSTQRVGFGQVLFSQDAYDLDNFWFQCEVSTDATKTIRAAVLYQAGTTDNATRDMVNNWASTTYTAGNFFHASWVPLAVASQSVGAGTPYRFSFPVAVPGNHKNLGVLIWTETQLVYDSFEARGETLTIGEPILSDAGCPQIYLPPSYSDELTACLGRYTKTFGMTVAPVQNVGNAQGAIRLSGNGGSIDTDWRFPVPMRKVPTCTTFNPLAANASWRDTTAGADRTATLGTATTSAVVINAGSTTTGNQMSIHATAEAEPCS
jgi:hypothetical protein